MTSEKINVLLVALHYYDDDENMLLSACKKGVSAAHHTFLNNLIDGLKVWTNLTILSSLPIGSFPKMSNRLIVQSKIREKGYEIGYINMPIIKDWMREKQTEKEIIKWFDGQENKRNCVVLLYDAITSFLKGAIKAKYKRRNLKNVLILPDLPGDYGIEKNTYNSLIEYRLRHKASDFYKCVRNIDGFIPLTKYMMNAMKVENKPYIVIECIVGDVNDVNDVNDVKSDQIKKLMYAGELSSKVNIDLLIKAVKIIDKCELYICGYGELEKEIKKISEKTDKINFLGFVPKSEMTYWEKQIDIFVNPRLENGNYTRYSFPSKNAEYLLSGKPLIAYMLSGIPDEYSEYMYIPNDFTEIELAKTIESVMNMDDEVLKQRSKKQLEFIRTKNKMLQGKRIADFLKTIIMH